jgi:hypothetical protein
VRHLIDGSSGFIGAPTENALVARRDGERAEDTREGSGYSPVALYA